MPDIREPNIVTPIWPTKPGKPAGKHKRPEQTDDRERERDNRRERDKPNDQPHIDDYA